MKASRRTGNRETVYGRQGLRLRPATRFSPLGAPPTDPYFSSVSLLLPMDGTNGSTTFADASSFAHTVTANNGAAISTAQSKWGGASGLYDGTNDYLSVPDSAAFDFGSGDFTMEAWIYLNSASGYNSIAGQWVSGNPSACSFTWRVDDGYYYFAVTIGGSLIGGYSSQTISASTWTHVAVTRSGGTVTLWKDGVAGTTTYSVSGSTVNSSAELCVGRTSSGDGLYFNGYIDDFRITKGVARYTANFTPPTAAFPTS